MTIYYFRGIFSVAKMGENCLNSMSTVFGFVYFVYLYFFLGVFQNHILLLFIIQKNTNAPLMFLNSQDRIFSYIKLLSLFKLFANL